jgi:predicted acyl esterase
VARDPSRMEMTVDYDLPVRLRDGILTYADVYRPRGRGRHPVLLTRTPYDKSGANGFPTPLTASGTATRS